MLSCDELTITVEFSAILEVMYVLFSETSVTFVDGANVDFVDEDEPMDEDDDTLVVSGGTKVEVPTLLEEVSVSVLTDDTTVGNTEGIDDITTELGVEVTDSEVIVEFIVSVVPLLTDTGFSLVIMDEVEIVGLVNVGFEVEISVLMVPEPLMLSDDDKTIELMETVGEVVIVLSVVPIVGPRSEDELMSVVLISVELTEIERVGMMLGIKLLTDSVDKLTILVESILDVVSFTKELVKTVVELVRNRSLVLFDVLSF